MATVFGKLNLKDHQQIVVLNPPHTFEREMAGLGGVQIVRDIKAAKEISFALAFVTQQQEVDRLASAISKKVTGDAVIWFAYPKKTSKNYKSDIERDRDWQTLGDLGFEGVRMVAIDEDWTAVRFRRAEYIKVLKRNESWAMSKTGKTKAKK